MNDKRKYPRLDIKGSVKYRIPENMDISMASLKNISGGGICLLAEHDLKENTTVTLELMLPGDSNPIIAGGEVRWCDALEQPLGRFSHCIGIQFVKIDDDKRKAIISFVVRRLKSQVREEMTAVQEKTGPETKKSKLLIVDDDKVVLKLVQDIFQENFTVITASNGYQGIEKAREWQPDLILLDIIMPELDGFSTLMLLKDFPETANIPVIMLSVLREKSKVFQAMQHGATAYILKPFTAESLFRKIRKVVKNI